MKITGFEEIEAWKEARVLVKELYAGFNNCRDYSFKDQIQRAGISIMANIAEGFERNTNKESSADVLHGRLFKISGLLNGFISYLKSTIKKK